jgi:hypothetical protein
MLKKLLLLILFLCPLLAVATPENYRPNANINVAKGGAGGAGGVGGAGGLGGNGTGFGTGYGYGGGAVSTGNVINLPAVGTAAGTGNLSNSGSQQLSGTQSVSAVNVAGSTNYSVPNQAPPIYMTSSPSFSNRNCKPVGSANVTSPFAGVGIAVPMGGVTCDALNISDVIDIWVKETGNQRLWLVECELLAGSNDELAEAFKKAEYSCKQAYLDKKSAIDAKAKQQLANQQAMQKQPPFRASDYQKPQ